MIGAVAVYTPLPLRDADRLTRAHGLGQARAVEGVLAGSVNSNFFVEADRRVFARIYEEQERDGVAYEWALLSHLEAAGVPVPRRDPARRDRPRPNARHRVLSGATRTAR